MDTTRDTIAARLDKLERLARHLKETAKRGPADRRLVASIGLQGIEERAAQARKVLRLRYGVTNPRRKLGD